MARPKKIRKVGFEPDVSYFKPRGIPLSKLRETSLTVDELESLRLRYVKDMNQTEAADKMGVHQSTLHRIEKKALGKIAKALTKGLAIKIEGGKYKKVKPGGPEYCVCPECGWKIKHKKGVPCVNISCKKCGKKLIRGDMI